MTNVLIINTDYLPNRNGGTIRVEKFLKYSYNSDFRFFMVTKRNRGFLKEENFENCKVYRTSPFDLFALGYKWKLFLNDLFSKKNNLAIEIKPNISVSNSRFSDRVIAPDTDLFWAIGAIYKAINVIRHNKIQVIYSTSPSSSVHLLAYVLIKLFRKRLVWISEFRDPWTFNPFREKKPQVLEYLDHFFEKKVILKCNAIIVVSSHFKDVFLEKYNSLKPSKIHVIPNGFDVDDFIGLDPLESNSNFGVLTITHTGNFYEKRSLLPFLKALKDIEKLNINIRFKQYGNIDPAASAYLRDNPSDKIEINSTVTHQESLRAINSSDWVLLIPGPGKGTMTGKIFEYIVYKKPVFAIVDEGPAMSLINENNLGICVGTENIQNISEALLKISKNEIKIEYADIESGSLKKYNRKNIAENIREVFKLTKTNV